MRALLVGATGFIGRRLAPELRERGIDVRCLVRDPDDAESRELAAAGCELRRGDLADQPTLEGAAERCEVVYYLAHLMSAAGGEQPLGDREAAAARALAREAKRAGASQLIYLGGLGNGSASEHLESRERTAEVLRAQGPPLTYFRAAMVVGAESESYLLLRALVERLPALPAADWLQNRTQPIGVKAVVEYLAQAPFVEAARGREIELGGPEAMTYAEMVEGMAEALGEEMPASLPIRKVSAKSVGRAAGTVSRGDPEVARYLTAGLAGDTVVEDPSGAALFDVDLEPYTLSLARAIEDEARAADRARALQ